MYMLEFRNPMTNLVASKWISVEDIPDLQQIKKLVRQGFHLIFKSSSMETRSLLSLHIICKALEYAALQKR